MSLPRGNSRFTSHKDSGETQAKATTESGEYISDHYSVASIVATFDFLLTFTLLGSNSCLFGTVGVMSKVTSTETIG